MLVSVPYSSFILVVPMREVYCVPVCGIHTSCMGSLFPIVNSFSINITIKHLRILIWTAQKKISQKKKFERVYKKNTLRSALKKLLGQSSQDFNWVCWKVMVPFPINFKEIATKKKIIPAISWGGKRDIYFFLNNSLICRCWRGHRCSSFWFWIGRWEETNRHCGGEEPICPSRT